LSAPAGTPKQIVDRINADVSKILQSPDVIDKFRNEGAVPKRVTPAEFSAFLRDEIAKWSKVIKFAKVEPL